MIIQNAFKSNNLPSPRNWQYGLKCGKVVGVKPEEKTVDVVLMTGGIYYGCKVLAPMATTSTGSSYLPRMHLDKKPTESGYDIPRAFGKRDIFAIIAFIEGQGGSPVVLGFIFPEKNQFSFPFEGYENQKLDRHESDRYHRIVGDTVERLGGEDVAGTEEIRYPDNSFMKIYPDGESKNLENISTGILDREETPFEVKKEERKGFYFQHSSGSAVQIDPDGQIKVSHHKGSWLSIGSSDANISKETPAIPTIDSVNNPPTAASSSSTKVHIEHESGTKISIATDGKITIDSVAKIEIDGASDIDIHAAANIDIEGAMINLN